MDSVENLLKNSNITNIMNAVANKYAKSIDLDEIESIKMNTLWKCRQNFDPDRRVKFTSYLYQQLTFALKNELKKKKPVWPCDNLQLDLMSQSRRANHSESEELIDILSGLPEDVKRILKQRFIGNMTMVEIAKANGYSRETARRRLKRAIKICKKSNGYVT